MRSTGGTRPRPIFSPEERGSLRRAFHAAGEPRRFRILSLLLGGRRAVGEIVAALDCPQPLISHHLAVLRRAGLIDAVADGRRRLYGLCDRPDADVRPILDLLRGSGATGFGHAERSPAARGESPAPPPPSDPPQDLEDYLL